MRLASSSPDFWVSCALGGAQRAERYRCHTDAAAPRGTVGGGEDDALVECILLKMASNDGLTESRMIVASGTIAMVPGGSRFAVGYLPTGHVHQDR